MFPRCREDRGIDPPPGKRQGVVSSEYRHRARPVHHAGPRGHGLDHSFLVGRHPERGLVVRRRTICRFPGTMAAGHSGRVAAGRRVVCAGASEAARHRPVGRHRHRSGNFGRDCAGALRDLTRQPLKAGVISTIGVPGDCGFVPAGSTDTAKPRIEPTAGSGERKTRPQPLAAGNSPQS